MVKKLHLNEAESDYVRIGNMVLPKNAANLGYADYDTVANAGKRAYDAEKEAERKAAEKAAREASAKQDIDTFEDIYTEYIEGQDIESTMSKLFNAFVPASGATNSMAAELIRAVERIRYRDYNDGDIFYAGYGLDVCGPCAAFIAENTDSTIEDFICNIADRNEQGDQYTEDLITLAEYIIDYIYNNLDDFAKPAENCINFNSNYLDEWETASHCYEFEPDTSGDYLDQLLDHDCVSWDDVKEFLEWQARDTGGEVNQWALDGFTITDLDTDEYREWEENWDNWWLQWLEEQMSEHEDELYGEDDYDEDDYDED